MLAILLCFWPLGLVALIKAVESRTYNRSGQYDESDVSATYAKKYLKYSVMVGIFVYLILVLIGFAVAITVLVMHVHVTLKVHATAVMIDPE